MNLDEAQKQTVRSWIDQGLKLADVQKKLAAELGVHLTYMETRFLMDDLQLHPKDPEPPPAPPAAPEEKAPAAKPADPLSPAKGGVSLTVDQVTRPGSVVSGKVTFSDGNSAEWYLDQFGRLGLAAQKQGYRPSQPDLQTFQMQLQTELQKIGL